MFIDDLWIDVLQSEEAEKELRELEQAGDGKKVAEFWAAEGWRILAPDKPYIDTVPLWVLLSAYELRFRDVRIVYGILRNLDFYDEGVLIDNDTIEVIISVIEKYASIGLYGETEDKLTMGMIAPKRLAVLFRYETPKDKARAFMDKCGLVQKKAVDGFPMPMLVQNYHQTRGDSSGTEEQGENLPLTAEKVLEEVFRWHMAEPEVRFIHVGLLRLQRKNNEETYRIAWKCYGEKIPESFGRSVRHQWEKFLEYAEQRGLDRAMLNRMIS
ncbi:MAG: hypothetical protein ACLU6O_01250 [Bilophila wadsworthia]